MKSVATAKRTAGGYPGDADPAGDRVQAASPRREHEQHEAGGEPQQRVALAQPAAPDQLEDDQQEQDRRDRGGDRDVERRDGVHQDSSSGTTRRRKMPTSKRQRHLDRVVEGAQHRDRRAAGLAAAHLRRHLEDAQPVTHDHHRRLDLGVVVRVVGGEEPDRPRVDRLEARTSYRSASGASAARRAERTSGSPHGGRTARL